jgi:hypothetical protein
MWAPLKPAAQRAGIIEDVAASRAYLRNVLGNNFSRGRRPPAHATRLRGQRRRRQLDQITDKEGAQAMPETTPCIITVAITGSLPRKENNPAVPVTIPEQVESTQEAFEAGATLAHLHVRNDDQSSSSDPAKFARLKEELERHCPA